LKTVVPFNLGILQALAQMKLLSQFNYLSTVSGRRLHCGEHISFQTAGEYRRQPVLDLSYFFLLPLPLVPGFGGFLPLSGLGGL
jgi:hypothetical protein